MLKRTIAAGQRRFSCDLKWRSMDATKKSKRERSMFKAIRNLAAFAIPLAMFSSPLSAQSVQEFYKLNNLQLRVGSSPGGGYDTVGRSVGAHIARHIPGNPSVVIQNVPGAGSLVLANQIANTAPRDGSVIGLVQNGMLVAPLLMGGKAKFAMGGLTLIGSPAPETQIVVVSRASKANSIKDILTNEIIVGASAPGTGIHDMSLAMNSLLGTKFKIVSGYKGTSDIDLAIERGEVEGYGAQGWGSVRARNLAQVKRGDLRILAQYGTSKHPELSDVPLFDLPTDIIDRQAVLLMWARPAIGRPFIAPPGIPADRTAALRNAFDATMKDPKFLAEATKLGLEVNPTTGAELDAIVAELAVTSPKAVQRLLKILSH